MSTGSEIVVYKSPSGKKQTLMPRGKPFDTGYDPRRSGKGRPGRLDDPEFVQLFAEAVSTGLSNKDLSLVFDVPASTCKEYKKDPRVKVLVRKRTEDRVLEISRKIDSQIQARLQEAHKLDIDTLLKIRKEFLGGAFRAQAEGADKDDPTTINETIAQIEQNPQLLSDLLAILEKDTETV